MPNTSRETAKLLSTISSSLSPAPQEGRPDERESGDDRQKHDRGYAGHPLPLELLFDLTFVAGFGQIADETAHVVRLAVAVVTGYERSAIGTKKVLRRPCATELYPTAACTAAVGAVTSVSVRP